MKQSLIARFMGPTWGPSGADRIQVGPMLAPWTLLFGKLRDIRSFNSLQQKWIGQYWDENWGLWHTHTHTNTHLCYPNKQLDLMQFQKQGPFSITIIPIWMFSKIIKNQKLVYNYVNIPTVIFMGMFFCYLYKCNRCVLGTVVSSSMIWKETTDRHRPSFVIRSPNYHWM